MYLSATAPTNMHWSGHPADRPWNPAVRPEIVLGMGEEIPTVRIRVMDYCLMTVNSILDKMELVNTESRSLAAHRDVLLRKLV